MKFACLLCVAAAILEIGEMRDAATVENDDVVLIRNGKLESDLPFEHPSLREQHRVGRERYRARTGDVRDDPYRSRVLPQMPLEDPRQRRLAGAVRTPNRNECPDAISLPRRPAFSAWD